MSQFLVILGFVVRSKDLSRWLSSSLFSLSRIAIPSCFLYFLCMSAGESDTVELPPSLALVFPPVFLVLVVSTEYGHLTDLIVCFLFLSVCLSRTLFLGWLSCVKFPGTCDLSGVIIDLWQLLRQNKPNSFSLQLSHWHPHIFSNKQLIILSKDISCLSVSTSSHLPLVLHFLYSFLEKLTGLTSLSGLDVSSSSQVHHRLVIVVGKWEWNCSKHMHTNHCI